MTPFRFTLLLLVAAAATASAKPVDVPSSPRAQAAEARVRPALQRDLAAAGLRYGAPVLVRLFKREHRLEVWVDDGQRFRLFRHYPICTWSGRLGPKLQQGDGQAPEGVYRIGPAQLNPTSQYHLAFNLGYPNAFDRAHGRTGSYLMVHGNCVSIGCYAMGDGNIEEIYSLVAAALRGGQPSVPVLAWPFRFDASDAPSMLAHRTWGGFWQQLRAIDHAFDSTRRMPAVRVVDGAYRVQP